MEDDWDLHAVVRGCSSAGTATSTISTAASTISSDDNPFPYTSFYNDQSSFDFPAGLNADPFTGLQEIYREFCAETPPCAATGISIPAAQVFQAHQQTGHIQREESRMNIEIREENIQFKNMKIGSSSPPSSLYFPAGTCSQQPNRQRRKKNQLAKIVHQMTQEELSADSWAWRKYGQKPIKGSPYPRNYYRCSTSKGCAARKQVERSPTEPGIFIVSYTGDHTHPRPTHRSSLAGSTRSKFSPATTKNSNGGLLFQKGSALSSPSPGSSFSPTTPLVEGEAAAQNDDVEMAEEEESGGRDEEQENINVVLNDDEDLFKGFQDSDHSSGGEGLFSGGLLSPPWTPTSPAATFSGGGGG